MGDNHILFNKPYMTSKELYKIAGAHFDGTLAVVLLQKSQVWLGEKNR